MVRIEESSEVDIRRGEAVEHELNRLIEKRHDRRATAEGHRRWDHERQARVGSDGFAYDGAKSVRHDAA
jgi:hypothetical protein